MLRMQENKAEHPSVCVYLVKDQALGCVCSSESVRSVKHFESFVILPLPAELPWSFSFSFCVVSIEGYLGNKRENPEQKALCGKGKREKEIL